VTKSRRDWNNERVAFDNPFATLRPPAGACPPEALPGHDEESTSPKEEAPMPKAKSAAITRAGRGGKTVTIVRFFANPCEQSCLRWLRQIKKSLGIGGTIEEGAVVLQGDQTVRLQDEGWLPKR